MSPVADATTEPTRADAVAQAVAAVRDGSLVVLPTDTVYGIGCDAFDAAAVSALLAAKGRGRDVPPPVLIGQVRTLDGIATDIQPYVRDLVERFWPGALTVVLSAQPSLHWDLGDTDGTVAVRMPDDPIALAVLAETGPMAVTSANLHGQPAATTILDAATQLGAAVAVYVDGGPRATQQPSTILDCTGPAPVVLREGAISEDDLSAIAALGEQARERHTDGDADDDAPALHTDEALGDHA
ncbi:L-threonylcarbamoyladenylate synthase [Nostocoides vanveenii]|uniref:L-threonylcarbamoyladenylate synthase n=1 Tax=Nostocoides vanveenii TaxID=330835 RepID=A0ABP4WUL4_9MICO